MRQTATEEIDEIGWDDQMHCAWRRFKGSNKFEYSEDVIEPEGATDDTEVVAVWGDFHWSVPSITVADWRKLATRSRPASSNSLEVYWSGKHIKTGDVQVICFRFCFDMFEMFRFLESSPSNCLWMDLITDLFKLRSCKTLENKPGQGKHQQGQALDNRLASGVRE